MITLLRWGALAALVLAGASGYADEKAKPASKAPANQSQAGANAEKESDARSTAAADIMRLELGRRLIGMEARSSDGKPLGIVTDIALDSADDRVGYLAIQTAGAERRVVALPWSQAAFSAPAGASRGVLTTSISEADFKRAKGIDADEWPRTADLRLIGVRPDENQPPDLNPSASPEAPSSIVPIASRDTFLSMCGTCP